MIKLAIYQHGLLDDIIKCDLARI